MPRRRPSLPPIGDEDALLSFDPLCLGDRRPNGRIQTDIRIKSAPADRAGACGVGDGVAIVLDSDAESGHSENGGLSFEEALREAERLSKMESLEYQSTYHVNGDMDTLNTLEQRDDVLFNQAVGDPFSVTLHFSDDGGCSDELHDHCGKGGVISDSRHNRLSEKRSPEHYDSAAERLLSQQKRRAVSKVSGAAVGADCSPDSKLKRSSFEVGEEGDERQRATAKRRRNDNILAENPTSSLPSASSSSSSFAPRSASASASIKTSRGDGKEQSRETGRYARSMRAMMLGAATGTSGNKSARTVPGGSAFVNAERVSGAASDGDAAERSCSSDTEEDISSRNMISASQPLPRRGLAIIEDLEDEEAIDLTTSSALAPGVGAPALRMASEPVRNMTAAATAAAAAAMKRERATKIINASSAIPPSSTVYKLPEALQASEDSLGLAERCQCAYLSQGHDVQCILHAIGVQQKPRKLTATGTRLAGTAEIGLAAAASEALLAEAAEEPIDTRSLLELAQHACTNTTRDAIVQADISKWLKPGPREKTSLVTLRCDVNLVNGDTAGSLILGKLQNALKNVRIMTVDTSSHSDEALRSRYLATFVWTRTLSADITKAAHEKGDVSSSQILALEDDRKKVIACNKYRVAVLQKYVQEQEQRAKLTELTATQNEEIRPSDNSGTRDKRALSEAIPAHFRPARVTPASARSAADPTIHELTEPFLVRRMLMQEFALLHQEQTLNFVLEALVSAAEAIAGVEPLTVTMARPIRLRSQNVVLDHHHLYKVFIVLEGSERWFADRQRVINAVARKSIAGQPISDRERAEAQAASTSIALRSELDSVITMLQLRYRVQIRLSQSPDETAKFVEDLTESIVHAPYRAEREFHNFCALTTKQARGKVSTARSQLRPSDAARWDLKKHEKFCSMLRQITGVGFPAAIAIVLKFDTPGALLGAYAAQSLSVRAKEEMLADIPCYTVRNATAAAQTRGQRVGPALSRKVYRFFTAPEGEADLLVTDLAGNR